MNTELLGSELHSLDHHFYLKEKLKKKIMLQKERTSPITACYTLSNEPALVPQQVTARVQLSATVPRPPGFTQRHGSSPEHTDQGTGCSHWHPTPAYRTDITLSPNRTTGLLQHRCETHQTNRTRERRCSLAHFSKTDTLISYSPILLLYWFVFTAYLDARASRPQRIPESQRERI